MEETVKLMNDFEERNNISIALELYSDNSLNVKEFWGDEVLHESQSKEELHEFLKNTQYELDEDGTCYSPVRTIK